MGGWERTASRHPFKSLRKFPRMGKHFFYFLLYVRYFVVAKLGRCFFLKLYFCEKIKTRESYLLCGIFALWKQRVGEKNGRVAAARMRTELKRS
jgi:hypothetical protein